MTIDSSNFKLLKYSKYESVQSKVYCMLLIKYSKRCNKIEVKFYFIYTTLIKHILYQVLGSDFSFLKMTRGFHIFGPPLVNKKKK